MFKKHDISGFFLVMRHVWTPFWTLKLLPFIESVQKRGSKNGPDTGRTDARTDVTNGLTEYFWGLYTIALRAIIQNVLHEYSHKIW